MSDIESLLEETALEEVQKEKREQISISKPTRASNTSSSLLKEAAAQVQQENVEARANRASHPETEEESYESDYDESPTKENIEPSKLKPKESKLKDSYSSSESEEWDNKLVSNDASQIRILCYNGNTNVLEKTLSNLKDMNVLFQKDAHGWTCVHWCAAKGRKACLEVLLDFAKKKRKALVNVIEDTVGWAPLHLACIGGHMVRHF
jgi:hypothetical protein